MTVYKDKRNAHYGVVICFSSPHFFKGTLKCSRKCYVHWNWIFLYIRSLTIWIRTFTFSSNDYWHILNEELPHTIKCRLARQPTNALVCILSGATSVICVADTRSFELKFVLGDFFPHIQAAVRFREGITLENKITNVLWA